MNSNPAPTAPMRLQLTEPSVVQTEASPGVIRLLTERLELVEDLWQTVLRSECPPEQVERLLHLKELSGPVAPGLDPEASSAVDTDGIVALIKAMDLAEGIAAARAFSLYFQLVNILEQHIEEDSYLESIKRAPTPASNDPFLPALAAEFMARPVFHRGGGLGGQLIV